MGGGPIPPPPWKWHPTQLYDSYRCCPSDIAYAFSSYSFFVGRDDATAGCDEGPPAWTELITTPPATSALGGSTRKPRSSRLQAPTTLKPPQHNRTMKLLDRQRMANLHRRTTFSRHSVAA